MKRPIRLPIRFRLTATFALLMAVVLFGMSLFLYVRLEATLDHSIKKDLSTRLHAILATIGRVPDPFGTQAGLIHSDENFAQVVGDGGRVIDSSVALGPRPVVSPSRLTTIRGRVAFDRTVTTSHELIPARFVATRTAGGLIVIVGASLEARTEALSDLRTLLWIGGPAALATTTAIIWFLSGAALRPVERLRSRAEDISGSDPDRRLPVPDTGDEIERLAHTLNDMLERIEGALARERRLVDDASHELRTPLGILQAEIELALSRSRTTEELVTALRSAGEESEKLNRLAEDLLVLAPLNRGRLPIRKERVEVTTLTREVVDGFAGRAKAHTVAIELEGANGFAVDLDPTRLRQALSNLLDNALSHSPAGGTVTVGVRRRETSVEMTVSDEGEGFPVGFLSEAFEPFSRADGARTRRNGGVGLGLSIVRAIVEAHGGTVTASNGARGGAEVRMRIPAR